MLEEIRKNEEIVERWEKENIKRLGHCINYKET
jgi:hypothetical protein